MSGFISCKGDGFVIFDEQAYYNDIYGNAGLHIKPEMYAIHNEFMPDSQWEAISERPDRRVRKRRRVDGRDQEVMERAAFIQRKVKEIAQAGLDAGFFTDDKVLDNNLAARDVEEMGRNGEEVMFHQEAIPTTQIEQVTSLDPATAFAQVSGYWKSGDESVRMGGANGGGVYVIPENAMFHVGDVNDVTAFCEMHDHRFSLVCADPPWENASVRRKQRYVTGESCLDSLDLGRLVREDGMVVVWITNRTGLLADVDEWLKKQGLQRRAIWHWLKMTSRGKSVCEFNTAHKLPFESVVIAARGEVHIPDQMILASVPSAVHSRKPPIVPLLKAFGWRVEEKQEEKEVNGADENGLPLVCEMFARCLHPDTLSIGYQPLALQNMCYFEEV